jgi:hypothetical protein
MDILKALLIWSGQFTAQLVGIVLGLFLVPIFLLFPDDSKKYENYKKQDGNEWWLRTLPSWALWWDNKVDGTLGDDDYRWASRDIPFGWKNTSFMGQYWWMAIRNPFNYFKRFILACDVRENEVVKLAGQDKVRDDLNTTGWHFLKCGKFYTFYGVWVIYGSRAVVIQLGNKFDLEDNFKGYTSEKEYKYLKGFTFEVNPFKDIA